MKIMWLNYFFLIGRIGQANPILFRNISGIMTNENADTSVETVEELQARLAKAEAKIVELKKAGKAKEDVVETKEEEPTTVEKKEETEEVTGSNNNDEIQKQIDEAVAKALEEAKFDANIAHTNSMSLSWANTPVDNWFSLLKPDEYDSLPASSQQEYMQKSIEKFGSFKLTLWEE